MNPPRVTVGDLLTGLMPTARGGHLLAPAGRWKKYRRWVTVSTHVKGDVADVTYEFDNSEAAMEFCRGLESINLGFTREEEFA